MNRSDSYKSACEAPPRPPPPRMNSIVESYGFNLVEYYLNERKDEYTSPRQLNVACGTFNVNGKEPPEAGLDAWLTNFDEQTHLVAIGFQELQLDKDAYAGQYLRESAKFVECQEKWRVAVTASVKKVNGKLVKIGEERLVGIYILVFAISDILDDIKGVQSAQIGVGILGYIGNKGAVAIRLKINEAYLCFVCTHLAAHQNEIEKRNRHFRLIMNNLKFKGIQDEEWFARQTHVIWVGDLNYRLDLDNDSVRSLVKEANYDTLLKHDQLAKVKLRGEAFHQFREADITFPPTYKFNPGSSEYDTSPKNRIPAWTDRILYHAKCWDDIRPVSYMSHSAILFSDHKPVSATFNVTVPVKNETNFRQVQREVIAEVDKNENELLPAISLSTQHVDFGPIGFDQSVVRNIRLQNTGKVPALYQIKDARESLLNRPGESKQLLGDMGIHITPTKGIISHKDEHNFTTIQLTLTIDLKTASTFNCGHSGKCPIEELIVLVQLGDERDTERPPAVHYITLTCDFSFSCFGMPRKVLCLKGPHTPCLSLTYTKIEQFIKADDESRGNFIPLELWKLMDELHRRGMGSTTMFRAQGVESERNAIISALDGGIDGAVQDEDLPGDVLTVAEVLLLFLNSMPEPIVPYSLYELCINNSDNANLMKQIKSNFKPECATLFEYITSFLRELVSNTENGLTGPYLADKFRYSILRPDPTRNLLLTIHDEEKMATKFILNFIQPS